MTRYLISFDDGTMIVPDQDMGDVARAAHEVVRQAQRAGVWITGAGLQSQRSSVVAPDGTINDGPYPETKAVLGGFAIVDVPSHGEALQWASRFAAACRCSQEVRELMSDSDV
jgi:hypothetical protein